MLTWSIVFLFALCFGGLAWYFVGGVKIKAGWQNGQSPLARYLDNKRREKFNQQLPEALDMLQAMNTGHDGSLTTVHANSPRDVISRLETMVLMSGMELPSRAIREQIQSAVDIIIHESRMSDGSRKVTAITEVTGLEGSQIVMQDIFEFKQTGVDSQGKIIGVLKPTGAIPTWIDQVKARGIRVDMEMFR